MYGKTFLSRANVVCHKKASLKTSKFETQLYNASRVEGLVFLSMYEYIYAYMHMRMYICIFFYSFTYVFAVFIYLFV